MKEGQAHRRSGAARILGIGKSGGLTPPHPTQGSLEKGRGLVGKTKSEAVVAVSVRRGVEVLAFRRTQALDLKSYSDTKTEPSCVCISYIADYTTTASYFR